MCEPVAIHERVVGSLTLLAVGCSALTVLLSKDLFGHSTGLSLRPSYVWLEAATAGVLLLLVLALIVAYIYRLVHCPDAAGNKSELDVVSVSLAALWWSGVALWLSPQGRRRYRVARCLACMPTFRRGKPGWYTPVPERFHGDGQELVVRTADPRVLRWPVTSLPKYFRGRVCTKIAPDAQQECPTEYTTIATVVLYEAVTQDEAGAELLTTNFTHVQALRMQLVADVVWKAVMTSKPWEAIVNTPHFPWRAWCDSHRTLRSLLSGMLARMLPGPAAGATDHEARFFWAVLFDEVSKYLRAEADATPVLNLLTELPPGLHSKSVEWIERFEQGLLQKLYEAYGLEPGPSLLSADDGHVPVI